MAPILAIVLAAALTVWFTAAAGRRAADALGLAREFSGGLGVVMLCACGYGVFWASWLSPQAGFVVASACGVAFALVAVVDAVRVAREPELLAPAALAFAAAVAYGGLLGTRLAALPPGTSLNAAAEQIQGLPHDDVIPRLFADAVQAGLRPHVIDGDWHGSDRPPLQTGLVLLARPLFDQTAWETYGYASFAIVLQTLWIVCAWPLLRGLDLNRLRSALALVLVIVTPFCFINSVFVWPKLLPAGLVLIATALALRFRRDGDYRESGRIVTIFVAFALALLAHGGVIFTIVPVLAFLAPKVARRPFAFAAGLAAFVLLLAPWSLYQKYADPPGDRLLKWHLAGVIPITEEPFVPLLIGHYRETGVAGTLANKWQNLTALFSWPTLGAIDLVDRRLARAAAVDQFFTFFASDSYLAFGFAAAFLGAWRMRSWRAPADIMRLVAIVLASLGFWVLAMFGPGTTVNHQGSYATNVLFDLLLAVALVRFTEPFAAVLAAYGAIALARVYGSFAAGDATDTGAWVVCAVSATTLLAIPYLQAPSSRARRRGLTVAMVACAVVVGAIFVRVVRPDPASDLSPFALENIDVGTTGHAVLGASVPHRVVVAKGERVSASGWSADASSTSADASLAIRVDDGAPLPCFYGSDRPDVAKVFGNDAYAPSGFRCEIATATLAPGAHVVGFRAVSSDLTRVYKKDAQIDLVIGAAMTPLQGETSTKKRSGTK